MNNTNLKKVALNAIFFIIVFSITFFTVFNDKDAGDIFYWMTHVKERYIVLSLLTIPLFVGSESVIIYILFSKIGKKVRMRDCFKYSFIGFFFSCITPSASGGQPAQVYYMNRDGLSASLSTFVLLIVTIAYKLVLVVLGVIIFVLARPWLMEQMGKSIFLYYLGMILNIICIGAMIFVAFSKTLPTKILEGTICLLEKMHLIKHNEHRKQRILASMENYHGAADIVKNNKGLIFIVFVLTVFQRIVLFLVTYFVYLSLDLHAVGITAITTLQAVISISVDMLPLPGGMGVSENLFIEIFGKIFGENLVTPAMLISRGCSFYLLLIVSGLVTAMSRARDTKGRKKC